MGRRVNVRRAALSRRLGNGPLTVIRRSGDWDEGRFIPTEETISIRANVQPASVHELEQLPEGDRIKGLLLIVTTERLYITSDKQDEERVSDEIVWHGNRYKIMKVDDWSCHGFYKAYAMFKEVAED